MTTYNLAINKNPDFNTVNSLTNLVFDRNNVRSGRMATENQIQQLWQDIIRLEERIDYCCRDIVYWDFQVRIRDKYGNIITDYLENRTTGIARRGKNFVMRLPIKAVPKYEANSTVVGTANEANFVDGNTKSCVKDGLDLTFANGLCSLLYRGTSGQYYEMSNRKDTAGLAVGIQKIYSQTDLPVQVRMVDVNGNESSYYPVVRSGSLQPNWHFATADEQGNIDIQCYFPIPAGESTFGNGTYRVAYGRIYRLDLRDVTLGD